MSMAQVGQKRDRVPTLMELAQSESKHRIRESLRDAICECEKMHVYSGETQIHYNFPGLFEKIMSQHGAQFKIEDVNLYDYILFEPGESMDTEYAYNNVLTQFCIRGRRTPLITWSKIYFLASHRFRFPSLNWAFVQLKQLGLYLLDFRS